MKKKNKLILLATLLLVEGGLLFHQFSEADNKQGPSLNLVETKTTSPTADRRDRVSVRLDLLRSGFPISKKPAKNIFQSLQPPPPTPRPMIKRPPPIMPPPPPKPRVVFPPPPSPQKQQGPTPEEIALGKAKEELSQFRYLGYLERGDEASAFLSRGNELYIVKHQEEIEDRFIVQALSVEFIVLHEKQTGTEVRHLLEKTN